MAMIKLRFMLVVLEAGLVPLAFDGTNHPSKCRAEPRLAICSDKRAEHFV